MEEDLSELLCNSLNEQGFLFQEACAHCLEKTETGWEVKAFEYPVSLRGDDTRVDIVLRSRDSDLPEFWALIECKRADPEYVHWLFGSPGLPFGDALCSALGFECREVGPDRPFHAHQLVEPLHFGVTTYDVKSWVEVKKRPDKRASTPQSIENAFMQVLKGVGGFAQEQLDQRRKAQNTFKTFFIPVVVTTAKLYVASYKPEDVNLATGMIARQKVSLAPKGQLLEELEWVLLDYGAGERVAPGSIPKNYVGVDPGELQKYKTRSIFVVNSKSIVSFFSKLRLVNE